MEHTVYMGETRYAHKTLATQHKEKTAHGMYRGRDNIKMNLTEIWCEKDWIHLVQNERMWWDEELVKMVMNIWVP
jgi:hypothetical protein